MSLITRNAKEYNKMSQNLPKRSLRDFLPLRHPNHLLLAGANDRNLIITQRFHAGPLQANRDFSGIPWLYTAISRKVVGKSARNNPKRFCGWFWLHFSSKKFERMALETMDICLRVLKESTTNKFDSYNHQEQRYWSYPMLPFRIVACAFFPTTFLEIAVFQL